MNDFDERPEGIAYDITEALDDLDIGSTGEAKIERNGLYFRREENHDWLFVSRVGMVRDGEIEDAKEAVREFFAGHAAAYRSDR